MEEEEQKVEIEFTIKKKDGVNERDIMLTKFNVNGEGQELNKGPVAEQNENGDITAIPTETSKKGGRRNILRKTQRKRYSKSKSKRRLRR